MAQYEHLPLYKKAMDIAVYLENLVRGFSRHRLKPIAVARITVFRLRVWPSMPRRFLIAAWRSAGKLLLRFWHFRHSWRSFSLLKPAAYWADQGAAPIWAHVPIAPGRAIFSPSPSGRGQG